MSPRDQRERNFLYGGQGQGHKKSKYSFWSSKSGPGRYTDHLSDVVMARPDDRIDGKDASPEPSASYTRARSTPARSSRQKNSRTKNLSRRDSSETTETDHPPDASPSAGDCSPSPTRAPALHPFDRLASTVKQCPWMLGSDGPPQQHAPGGGNHHHSYYPPVPRSLPHDAALSFVVTDHTRPEQPRFVVSCPLEHVGLVPRLLAPDGARRVLRARGASGHPREGAQLRSMLLDGTPNIELALHHRADGAGDAGGPAASSVGCGRGVGGGDGGDAGGDGGDDGDDGDGCDGGGGGGQAGRRGGRAAVGSPADNDHECTNGGWGAGWWPQDEASGGTPRFVPMAWVPGVPMPPPRRPTTPTPPQPQPRRTGRGDVPPREDSEMPHDTPTPADV